GYDPLVRFNCLLIGQWHPEADARALNCGWISCYFAGATSFVPVPDATTHCRFRNPR
ncbi:MAG: IS5/IS1182 family transposase, partial [Rhodobacteraceae bacterium]|nr:IS5/IS1182 family transposase [Paracoccaceae bacterium]